MREKQHYRLNFLGQFSNPLVSIMVVKNITKGDNNEYEEERKSTKVRKGNKTIGLVSVPQGDLQLPLFLF